MKGIVSAAIVVVVMVVASCATPVPQEAKTRVYDAPKEEVFDAVKAVFAENSIQISGGSLESGFINGRQAGGNVAFIAVGESVTNVYNISFTKTDNGTMVQAFIGSESDVTTYESDVQAYEYFFGELEKKLQ